MQPQRNLPHSAQGSLSILVLSAMLIAVVLTGCGFHPLYGERASSAVANSELAAVDIDLIRDREGQMLRNALLDRFQPRGAALKPLFKLSIVLTQQRVGLAIRPDETGSRANLIIMAKYSVQDLANSAVLFSGSSRAITGYNVLNSDFATTSSEADAVRRAVFDLSEQITTRVSVALAARKPASPS